MEEELWTLADAFSEKTSTRERICLHGIWRVCPGSGDSGAPPQPDAIHYSQVPGRWNSTNHFQTFREQAGHLVPVDSVDGKPLHEYFDGWYTRYIRIPAGRRLLLTVEYLGAISARFFINDQFLREVKTGGQNAFGLMRTISLDISAFSGREILKLDVFLHFDQYPAPWDIEGLSLDYFFLHVLDSPLAVKDILVLPSWRNGNLRVDADLYNLDRTQETGYSIQARIFQAQDPDPVLESPLVDLALRGDEIENAVLALDWPDPVCWDLEHPHLYYAKIRLYHEGRLVEESLPQPFGFREMWEQDGNFYLNGNKIHLRTCSSSMIQRYHMLYCREETIADYLQAQKRAGFNAELAEICYKPTWGDGWQGFSPTYIKTVLSASDSMGYLWFLWAPPLLEGYDPDLHREELRVHLRQWGNHPSLAIHLASFNQAGYAWAQHPLMVNDLTYEPEWFHPNRELVRTAEAALRELDPSRPVYHNYSGNLNRIYTTMHYMSFGLPLQEQEDWPETWSKSRKTALFPSEFGIPFAGQFYAFDQPDYEGASLIVEHSARYFGDAIYAEITKPAPRHPGYLLRQSTDTLEGSTQDPALEKTVSLFARNLLRAWRGYDLCGFGVFEAENYMYGRRYDFFQIPGIQYDSIKTPGLKPNIVSVPGRLYDVSKPNAVARVVSEALAPVAAWIAGGPQDISNKDHGYFSGERMEKQIVLINDRPLTLAYRYAVMLESASGARDEIAGDGSIAPGETLRIPFAFSAPEVDARTEFSLALSLSIDNEELEDRFEIQIFPRPAYEPPGVLYGLVDSNGTTRSLLDRIGVQYREVSGRGQIPGIDALIVGRESLDDSARTLLADLREDGWTRAGLPILVLEQSDPGSGQLVFEQVSERHAFIQDESHPLLAGLADADFKNWRGGSDFFKTPTPVDPGTEYSPHYPHYKFRVSNRGIVATHAIRKPAFGSFHPILGTGFDMMNTPLAEMTVENSRVVFCQVDVTDHYGMDPAATILFQNLLDGLSNPPPTGPRPSRTLAIADAPFHAILEECRIDSVFVEGMPGDLSRYDVVIAANVPQLSDSEHASIRQFVQNGGVAVCCGGEVPSSLTAPFGIEPTVASIFHATITNHHPLLAGLGNSDFYFREPKAAILFRGEGADPILSDPILSVQDYGKGKFIFLGLDPENFRPSAPAGEQSFIDVYVHQKAYRILNTVLRNAGVRHLPLSPFEAAGDSRPMYISNLPDYDVNAFHNW